MKPNPLRTVFAAASFLAIATACSGGGSANAPVPAPNGNTGPTPVPTVTPAPPSSPPPTATPTAPPTPAPTPTPLPQSITANSTIVYGEDGRVNGIRDQFTPAYGDTADGANGQTVDGNLTCAYPGGEPRSTNTYHVNVWLGFYVNNQEVAPARAMGMVNPSPPPPPGTIIENAQCLYQIHNHDYSGTIHIEDTTMPPSTSAHYKLQQVFDVWGNGPQSKNWPFTGRVTVYAGTPTSQCCNGNDIVGRYTRIDDYPNLPLSRHTVIWIIVGPLPTNGLPQVEFTMAQ